MMLTREQVEQIRSTLENNGVTIPTLRDDLLDHVCCIVEEKTAKGEDFYSAVNKAFEEVAPQGFAVLEAETIKLLNGNNISMKKFLYITGLFTAIAMSIGFLFKILHWPGADELLSYGFLTFALVFTPLAIVNNLQVKTKRSTFDIIRISLGAASALLTGGGLLLKILAMPFGDQLLIGGIGIFSFGFLPCLFYSMYLRSISFSSQR